VVEKRRFTGRTAVITVIIGHVVLLASLIAATRLVVGLDDALTVRNQIAWVPLVYSQLFLLAIYLGLGGGASWMRLPLFFVGVLAAGMATRTAHLLLATPSPSYLGHFFNDWDLELVIDLLPMLCLGALLLPLRIPWGAIQGPRRGDRTTQFRLSDMLALMFVVAIAATVFSDVQDWEVGLIIDFRRMSYSIAAASLGMAGTVYLMFHNTWTRWFGLVGLGGGLVAGCFIWPIREWSDWGGPCFTYAVVVLTFFVLRTGGYRLRGGWLHQHARNQVA